MKKIILSLIFAVYVIASFGQQQFSGVFLRVNDSTTYISSSASKHSQGYHDIFFNNQATTPHFDIWNGSSYDHIFNFASGGGSFTLTDGNLTTANGSAVDVGGTASGNTDLDLNTHELFIHGGTYTTIEGSNEQIIRETNSNAQLKLHVGGAELDGGTQGATIKGTNISIENNGDPGGTGDFIKSDGASGAIWGTITADDLSTLTTSRTLTGADDLDQTDNLRIVYANSATPFNITVDLLSAGTQVTVINIGSATATLIEGSGVTLPGTTVPIAAGDNAVIIYRVAATPDVYTGSSAGGTVTSVSSANSDLTVASGTTTPVLTVVSAPKLTTARTIGTTTGDVTSAGSSFDGTGNNTNSTTVTRVNGVAFSGLATGILKNTTGTGAPSIAVAGDFPTLPYWALTGTSTLTGVTTITNPTVSGLLFNNSFTTTASDQFGMSIGGTITPRATANDNIYGAIINPAYDQKANGQSFIGVQINPSLSNVGGFSTTGSTYAHLLIGTKTTGLKFNASSILSTGAIQFGSSNTVTGTFPAGGSSFELGPTNSATTYTFVITNNNAGTNGGGLQYLKSIIGNAASNGATYYGINADAAFTNNWSNTSTFYGASFTNGFAPTGSSSTATYFRAAPVINATGGTTTVRFADWNPTETSLTGVSNYGVTIGGAALSGFGTRTPTERVDVVGNVKISNTALSSVLTLNNSAATTHKTYDMLWFDGTSNSGNTDVNIFNGYTDATAQIEFTVTAVKTSDGLEGYSAKKIATFHKDGSADATLVGTVSTVHSQENAATNTPDITISMNGANVRVAYDLGGGVDVYRWTIWAKVTITQL